MSSSFGILLKDIREKNKKTQTEIASIVGKSTMYISNIENGKNAPLKDDDLEVLLTELNVDDEERLKLRCAAIIESKKLPDEIIAYFAKEPYSLEFVIKLCEDKADKKSLDRIKTYYEENIKHYV